MNSCSNHNTLSIGHRGAKGYVAENTYESISKAIDIIEEKKIGKKFKHVIYHYIKVILLILEVLMKVILVGVLKTRT